MNNVVVKFVEDDMVLSINMKSAECFSVNHLWEKTYMDIGNLQQQQQQQPSAEFRLQSDEHHVRKILQLNDVTICLDKLDSRTNNKISFYQDPLIYRCSIQSRLDFKFSSNLNLNNIDQQLKLIKLNLYCRKFDMSITDKQLPMLIRLIELIIAISYGTLKLPESSGSSSSSSDLTFEHSDTMNASNQLKPNLNPASLNPTIISELKANDEQLSLDISNDLYTQQQQHQQQQQGWLSWAWSYVPSVSDLIPDGGEENVPTAAQLETLIKDPIQTIIGFYFDELNIAFKLTQQVNHDHHQSSKAYAFEPFVVCSMKGIAFESNLKQNFAHLLLGVSFINLRSMGSCCCRLCPKPTENEIVFLRAGSDYLEEKTFHYMSGSLFDIIEESLAMSNEEVLVNSTDNSSTKIDSAVFKPPVDLSSNNSKSRDKFGNVDENYGSQRFGAFLMDNLKTTIDIKKPKSENEANDSEMDINIELSSSHPDIASLVFILYDIEVNVSANLLHRTVKMFECSRQHEYTRPYSTLAHSPPVFNENSISAYLAELMSQQELNATDEISTQLHLKRIAKKLEKYIPLMNVSCTIKNPKIKMHPYSHFLIASIASQVFKVILIV